MAPINLPDGSQVSEIVLPDGSTASEVLAPDGSTVFGGIPDSAIHQYDASLVSATDGTTVSSLSDQIGSLDLDSGTGLTYRSSGINNNPSLEADGVDDILYSTSIPTAISEPFTAISVSRLDNAGTNNVLWNGRDSSGGQVAYYPEFNGDGLFFAGNGIQSGVVTTPVVAAGRDDDASNDSVLRQNQNESSGTVGAAGPIDSLLSIGASRQTDGAESDYFGGLFSELIFYDAALSDSAIVDEEQRLAAKWGITL